MKKPFSLIILLAFTLFEVACREQSTSQATPERTATLESSPTVTWTPIPLPSLTPSPTITLTPKPSLTPSQTSTLTTQVLEATVIMAGVTSANVPLMENVERILPTVPLPIEPLGNATLTTPPYYGWITFESDHPILEYGVGEWLPFQTPHASRGQYHYSIAPEALARFSFSGEAVQVRYICYANGGSWELVIDGEVRQTINSYAPDAQFVSTDLILLSPGQHLLEIRNTGQADAASTGTMVALDAIHVYQANPAAYIIPTVPTSTAMPSPKPAEFVQLQGAPTLRPTETQRPPAVAQVTIVVAYDENANRSIEPAEGVRGIPVRLVEVGTNRVIAQAFTDETGFASLQAISTGGLRLVVPYFGAYWGVEAGAQAFTLLIPPGHQPGLIP